MIRVAICKTRIAQSSFKRARERGGYEIRFERLFRPKLCLCQRRQGRCSDPELAQVGVRAILRGLPLEINDLSMPDPEAGEKCPQNADAIQHSLEDPSLVEMTQPRHEKRQEGGQ